MLIASYFQRKFYGNFFDHFTFGRQDTLISRSVFPVNPRDLDDLGIQKWIYEMKRRAEILV